MYAENSAYIEALKSKFLCRTSRRSQTGDKRLVVQLISITTLYFLP